jgi:Amt family ammonium transporter
MATLTWMIIDWVALKKPTVLGAATGSIAGLAAITPAAGSVGPVGALVIGALSGAICWLFSVKLKARFKYDDSLDVFGVHGVGGFIGTAMLGILAHDTFGGLRNDAEFGKQLLAAVFTVLYSAAVSAGLFFVLARTVGLRASEQAEREGLDSSEHGESAYSE